jgi:hypothetical protein
MSAIKKMYPDPPVETSYYLVNFTESHCMRLKNTKDVEEYLNSKEVLDKVLDNNDFRLFLGQEIPISLKFSVKDL